MNFANYLNNITEFMSLEKAMTIIDGGVPSPVLATPYIEVKIEQHLAELRKQGIDTTKVGYRFVMDEIYSAMCMHLFMMNKEHKLKYLSTIVFTLEEETRMINDMSSGWGLPKAMAFDDADAALEFLKPNTGLIINQELQSRTRKYLMGMAAFGHLVRIDLVTRDKTKPAMGDLRYQVEPRPTRAICYRIMQAEGRGV